MQMTEDLGNKDSKIRSIFSKIPSYYDVMNDAMSLGIHRLWKKKLVNLVRLRDGHKYLDLSTGSGDIALLLLKKSLFYNISLTCADPDQDMLNKAEEKLANKGFFDTEFVKTTAEQMPFDNNHFDCVTLSFGLRNFTDIKQGLSEIYRVLNSEGMFYCLEFSPYCNHSKLDYFYQKYLDALPFLGKVVAKDTSSYQYLSDSIKNFDDADTIDDVLRNIGFKKQEIIKLSVCNIWIYKKV